MKVSRLSNTPLKGGLCPCHKTVVENRFVDVAAVQRCDLHHHSVAETKELARRAHLEPVGLHEVQASEKGCTEGYQRLVQRLLSTPKIQLSLQILTAQQMLTLLRVPRICA